MAIRKGQRVRIENNAHVGHGTVLRTERARVRGGPSLAASTYAVVSWDSGNITVEPVWSLVEVFDRAGAQRESKRQAAFCRICQGPHVPKHGRT